MKEKKRGRPAVRNWDDVPAAAINAAEGKTRHTFILRMSSIDTLKALATAEGNTIGEELEICIQDRLVKYERVKGKLKI